MNALKKSSVLNRQCLRNKIDDLSPLLLQKFNLGGTCKDNLFRAVWSYYACGYPERLTSNRRRIEQIAKIVAPAGGPNTQFHKNLKLPPTGVDLEDRMYHELVSCFHSSNESPAMEKRPPKRSTVKKELKLGNYSTPEQWNSWKLEKQQVLQMLKQYQDPYRTEELTRKLEKLNKLTNRRPLIVLPDIREPHPLDAHTESVEKKRKERGKSVEPLKQPDKTAKPIGPYVNRISKAAANTPPETKLGKHGTKGRRSKANKGHKKKLVQPVYITNKTATQSAVQESEVGTNLSPYHHGWPHPIGLQRPIEQFKSYLQFKKKEKSKETIQTENPVQTHSKLHFYELRIPTERIDTTKSPEIRTTFSGDIGNKLDETKAVEIIPLKSVASDAASNKQDETRYLEYPSASNSKTFTSDQVSTENIHGNRPLIMADIILDCIKSYGSEISFKDASTSFMKANKLDRFSQENPIKKPQVKDKVKKIMTKKYKIKDKIKEDKINDEKFTMKIMKMPSKRETAPCSLCNLVRQRNTDLQPYMKQMQKERERLELKNYYTQNILRRRCCPKQDTLKSRRACAHQALTNCYQALGLCHWGLELRRLQGAQGCQPHHVRDMTNT